VKRRLTGGVNPAGGGRGKGIERGLEGERKGLGEGVYRPPSGGGQGKNVDRKTAWFMTGWVRVTLWARPWAANSGRSLVRPRRCFRIPAGSRPSVTSCRGARAAVASPV